MEELKACGAPDSFQQIIDRLLAEYGPDASVLVITQGGSVFPRLEP